MAAQTPKFFRSRKTTKNKTACNRGSLTTDLLCVYVTEVGFLAGGHATLPHLKEAHRNNFLRETRKIILKNY